MAAGALAAFEIIAAFTSFFDKCLIVVVKEIVGTDTHKKAGAVLAILLFFKKVKKVIIIGNLKLLAEYGEEYVGKCSAFNEALHIGTGRKCGSGCKAIALAKTYL